MAGSDSPERSDVLTVANAAQWEAWLAEHHEQPEGVWLRIARKGSGVDSITIGEAGDVALCYGWIDSQRRALDDRFYLQRYSKRRPGSPWSRVNVERVQALEAAGRMREPGLAEVRAAQADGRWQAAYAPQRSGTVPPELAAELQRNQRARTAFESLGKTERYLLMLPLSKARTASTRASKLRRIIDTLLARE
jgi:uncharacterized protein YdeI (YjbR/CyaY-like superfamily)